MPTPRRLAALTCLLAGACAIAAAQALPNRQCGGGVCLATVDASQAVAPCRHADLVLAWAQGGGAMSIECGVGDATTEQPTYVFDRRDPSRPAFELAGVRAFSPEALPQLAHVPGEGNDAMLPACRKPTPALMAPGELLLTQKVASDNERHPYCYRVLRVATSASGVAVRADDGKPPPPGAANGEWHELAMRMMALVAQADVPAHARVTHARAPLRDRADAKAPAHGFLVAGDMVTVLERAGAFVKVRYQPAKGAAIERWIARDDLAP